MEIAADGHCLFSAIADQLKRRGCGKWKLMAVQCGFSLLACSFVPNDFFAPAGEVDHDFKSLRKLAANYMLQHENHFKNFLSLAKETFQVPIF